VFKSPTRKPLEYLRLGKAAEVALLAFVVLQGCAVTPTAPPSGLHPSALSAVVAKIASQRGEDPLIGVWSGVASGFSWSVAILKEEDLATGYDLKGIMVQPWPYFSAGEEVLHLKRSSVPGIYEGTQKWKNALHVASWAPARVALEGGNLFTQFNSVRFPTMIATTWVYLRSDTPAGRKEAIPVKQEGSGFVLRGTRHVLTNHHVIEGAKEIRVVFQGQEYPAGVARQDPKNDLAILSVPDLALQPGDGLPVDVSLRVQAGEPIYAIGFPLGAQLSQEASIVNGLVNAVAGPNDDPTLFRVSAPLNPGNSGGPILNRHGQVVGIAASVLRGRLVEGIGFGIKIGTAAPILGDLALGANPGQVEPVSSEQMFEQVSPWVVRVVGR
jgi:S1-C subfamily serine protease